MRHIRSILSENETLSIEVDDVTIIYNEKRVLKNVHIKIEYGIVVGVLGRNGSGKTTLFEVIYGIRNGASSLIRFNGIFAPNLYKIYGAVLLLPQKSFMPLDIPILKLFELYNSDFERATQFFPELMSCKNSKMRVMSNGQVRLFEVIIVLTSASKFVILDEPFSAIMPAKIHALKALIGAEKARKGILLTDHSYRNVIEVCDRHYLLGNDGILVEVKDVYKDLIERGYLPNSAFE